MAEDLIVSYTKVKESAKRLSSLPGAMKHQSEERGVAGGGGWRGDVSGAEEEQWDLGLTLRTAEFNWAKLERLRLAGTRCVVIFELFIFVTFCNSMVLVW